MKKTIMLCIGLLAGFLSLAGNVDEVVWQLEPSITPPRSNWISGEGPDGNPCLRVEGSTSLKLDSTKMRGRLVVIEAWVRGENLGDDSLRIVPDYKTMHGEIFPPAPALKGTYGWTRFIASFRIPDFAGNLRLVFGHGGKHGIAYYSKVRIVTVALPEPYTQPKKTSGFVTTSRGAMTGDLRREADFCEFGEVWNGNLIRWQLQGTGKEFASAEEYMSWGHAEMERLDRIMPFLKKYGIRVVIDLHRSPGIQDRLLRNYGLWDKKLQDQIVSLWREIAARYKGNPLVYGYDLINEPVERNYDPWSDALDWNRLAERIARAVREIDPDTPIIITPANAGGPAAIAAFHPINLPNIIYTVHFYDPFSYTHNGVAGNPLKKELSWPSVGGNKAYLKRFFEPVRNFQQKYGVPVFIGEFGVACWSNGAENWLRDCIEIFEEYGWDWTFHAYREWDGWSVEHEGLPGALKKVSDTPRKQVILDFFRKNRKEGKPL